MTTPTPLPHARATPAELEQELQLGEELPPEPVDAFAAVLLRIMQTDPESNLVFSSLPRGEAEDFAAAITYAEFSGSPVILRYENMKNMAKRAESGHLLEKVLSTVKAVGKSDQPRAGFFTRFRGA